MENIPSVRKKEEFQQQVLQARKPVVVDFYIDWCENSQRLALVMTQLARQYGQQVHFVKVNVDDAAELERLYAIRVTPTVMLFESGRVSSRWENQLSPHDYEPALDRLAEARR